MKCSSLDSRGLTFEMQNNDKNLKLYTYVSLKPSATALTKSTIKVKNNDGLFPNKCFINGVNSTVYPY